MKLPKFVKGDLVMIDTKKAIIMGDDASIKNISDSYRYKVLLEAKGSHSWVEESRISLIKERQIHLINEFDPSSKRIYGGFKASDSELNSKKFWDESAVNEANTALQIDGKWFWCNGHHINVDEHHWDFFKINEVEKIAYKKNAV